MQKMDLKTLFVRELFKYIPYNFRDSKVKRKNKNMRIGIISVNDKSTSLLSRGGTEVFSANLAYELSKLGHEVFLFGSEDSLVNGVQIISTTSESLQVIQQDFEKEKWDEIKNIYHIKNILVAKKYESKIDIFHDNMSCSLSLAMHELFSKPIVSSLHMPIDDIYISEKMYKYIYSKSVTYVVASKFQKYRLSNYIKSEYIPNGINIHDFQKFGINNDTEDLIWIGRINSASPKGLDDAIRVATLLKKKLRYVGLIENLSYYKKNIESILNNNIIAQSHVPSLEKKILFYRSGKILINPIKWEEPFGLTFIEAMAVGTPVISYALGAAPEIIEDGKTGLLVNLSKEDNRGDWIIKKNGIEGLYEAVQYIYKLGKDEYFKMRQRCAITAKNKFNITKMAKEYENLYKRILNL